MKMIRLLCAALLSLAAWSNAPAEPKPLPWIVAQGRTLAKCDLVIVVGSPNSSNSNRLREVSENMGVPAYLGDRAEDLRPDWVAGTRRIGITAGASAPEVLVDELIARLKTLGAKSVRPLEGISENVVFTLPRELAPRG